MVKPEKKKIPTKFKPKHKNKGNKLVEMLQNADQQDAPSRIKRMLSFRKRAVERGEQKKPKLIQKQELTLANTTLDELERKSAHLSLVAGRKKTKKYLKKQEFLNRKETKPEMDLGLITEQKLLNQGTVRFQDYVMEPPKLTALPKDRSKKKTVEKIVIKEEESIKPPKQVNISSVTGERLGRSRKLKSLPEAERNSLLIQRQKAIDFYRLKHKK
jgi:hypothetical protein